MKKELMAKQLFVTGKTEVEIATILNVSARTIQNYKTKSKDDWLAEKMSTSISQKSIDDKEKEFLLLLIQGFEETFTAMKAIVPLSIEDAEKKLSLLERYTKTYWSIKNPKQKDEKIVKLTAILDTIKKISDIAIHENNIEVVNFLSLNTDKIINSISS